MVIFLSSSEKGNNASFWQIYGWSDIFSFYKSYKLLNILELSSDQALWFWQYELLDEIMDFGHEDGLESVPAFGWRRFPSLESFADPFPGLHISPNLDKVILPCMVEHTIKWLHVWQQVNNFSVINMLNTFSYSITTYFPHNKYYHSYCNSHLLCQTCPKCTTWYLDSK